MRDEERNERARERIATRYWLVRHGEVDDGWHGRLYGRLDVELSERGRMQSRQIARALAGVHLDAVVSSGLARAEFAAELLRASRPGVERRDEPDLLEIDRGDWAGWDRERIEAARSGAWDEWSRSRGAIVPPGGESLADVGVRVRAELAALREEHPNGVVAIVAHLWIVRSAVAFALGMPTEHVASIAVPPGGIALLEWAADRSAPELVSLGVETDSPRFGEA